MRAFPLFAVLAIALSSCGSEVPSVLRDDYLQTTRMHSNATTIVFFTDFQCPFCRKTHAALAPLVEARHDRVRVVLKHVPLRSHPDAKTAARAAVCFEALTQKPGAWVAQDDYAHALFASPDLSEAACEELAVEHGVDRDHFQRCLSNAATDARIQRDIEAFESLDGDGVPLLFVGGKRLEGNQSRAKLEAAIEEAL